MRRIRFILTLFFLSLCTLVKAQSLSVESFRLLENDLTANTRGTMMRDQNGEVAALIRVVTSEKGFVFDGGMMGIVGTKQDVGEILLYVPHGIQKITIKHDQLGVLRDYYFPIPIEKARTYEMKLFSGRVKTVIEDDFAAQYAVFTVEPKNAVVYIDGTPYNTQTDGTVTQLLSYGTHEYRIESYGYKTQAGIIELGKDKVFLDVKLESTLATITLQCPMPEADLYINDEKVGTGSWTGQLAPAMYKIESKREYYQDRVMTLTVHEQEVRTVSVPEPLVQYGKLQVHSTPFNATVYIDGVESGTTPLFVNEIEAGMHRIDIKLDDYKDYFTGLTVKATETVEINATLQFDAAQKARKERQIKKENRILLTKTDFYAGFTLDKGNIASPGKVVRVGTDLGGFNMELKYGFFYEDAAVYDGYWNTDTPVDNNSDGIPDSYKSYRYKYSLKSVAGASLGYGVIVSKMVRFTPQVGVNINMIESLVDESIVAYGGSGKNRAYVYSVPMGLKLEFSPVSHIALVYNPQYNLPVKYGNLANRLDVIDNCVEKSVKGLWHCIGLVVYLNTKSK